MLKALDSSSHITFCNNKLRKLTKVKLYEDVLDETLHLKQKLNNFFGLHNHFVHLSVVCRGCSFSHL